MILDASPEPAGAVGAPKVNLGASADCRLPKSGLGASVDPKRGFGGVEVEAEAPNNGRGTP